MSRMRWVWALIVLVLTATAGAQPADSAGQDSEARDRLLRDRYEQALRRNPLQEQSFDRVYESYLILDGLDAWVEKLESGLEASESRSADLILLGRIRARQFKTAEAIRALEEARSLGADDPDLHLLLGTLYYDAGRNDEAAALLTSALDTVADPEKRGRICRILGSLYLRQGDREAAAAAWKRLVDRDPTDTYAVMELADVYRENRMWAEAVETLRRLIELSSDNAYRRCWAERAIGDCYIELEQHAEAIAAYERGLELAAPGNWLFEDLKQRLVGVYQDLGDLEGLAAYARERVAADPADLDFRELLAETYARMARHGDAEAEYRQVLDRAPDRIATYERLIEVYRAVAQPERVRETYEQLIERVPSDPEYVRRLGETWLEAGQPEEAKAVWRRVVGPDAGAGAWALLGSWFEQYDFPDDAIAAYEKALALAASPEWTFRLAALRHEKGEEEEAVRLWTSVLDDGSPASDHAEVASILISYGKSAEAEPLLRKAVELEPDNYEHTAALARLLMQGERFEEAVPLFTALAEQSENEYFRSRGEQGLIDAYTSLGVLAEKQQAWEAEVAANPEAVAPKLRLARLYRHAGNHPGAVALYEQCIQQEPENPEFLRQLAEACLANRQMDRAMEVYARLADLDPTRAGGYLRDLLRLYVRAGRRDEAVATARRIVERTPGDPEARIDLAQTLMLYNEADEALSEYRHALRLAPEEPDFHRQYGEALASQGRWGEAQEAYRRMLDTAREDSTRLDAVNRLGFVYQQQGRLDDLLQEFQARVRQTPKKLSAYQEVAALHKIGSNHGRALEVLDEAANAVDDKAEALRLLLNESYSLREFERAAASLQQLMALSGQPSVAELERLGSIYYQLGDTDRARAAWKRITDEHPDDPGAHKTVARSLFEAGLIDEALEAEARALELDPYDFRLRFDYAQQLAASERVDEALVQLQQILERGERPAPEEGAEGTEKKVRPLQGGPGGSSPYGFYPYGGIGGFMPSVSGPVPMGWFGGGMGAVMSSRWSPYSSFIPYPGAMYGPSRASGTFEEFRPSVIAAMAEMGRRLGDDQIVVDYFLKKAEENPTNVQAQFDLLTVYTVLQRWEEALGKAEELLAARPDDNELLQQVAGFYASREMPEKALEKYEILLERLEGDPKRALISQVIHLKVRLDRKEEALALARSMLEENPDDIGAIFQVGSALQSTGKADEAKELYAQALEQHPKHRYQLRNVMASLAQQQGDLDEAWAIQEEMLFGPEPTDSTARPGVALHQMYIPQPVGSRMAHFGRDLASMVRFLLPSVPHMRLEALSNLMRYGIGQEERLEDVEKRIEETAATATASTDPEAQALAHDMVRIRLAMLAGRGEFEAALALLESLGPDVASDPELVNFRIFLYDELNRYAEMGPLYDALEARFPALAAQARLGRVNVAILAKDYDVVSREARELLRQPGGFSMALNLLQALRQAGQNALARQLLEEHAEGAGRRLDPQVAETLARFYAEDRDFDKAIALAREALDRQPAAASFAWYGGHPRYSRRSGSVEMLASYYQQAGRLPELIAEFEERLAKQPSSVQFHEDLAHLYRMNNELSRAIELYEKLLEMRPNNSRVQTTLAELFKQAGQPRRALEIYEKMLRTQPSLFAHMNHEVRQLYHQMGKTDELASLEDEMIRRSSNPDVLRNLAWEARGRGDLDRAVELFEKLVALDPRQTHVRMELAQAYEQAGRTEDALKAYRSYFETARANAAWYEPHTLRQLVSLYDRLGRLDELKAEAEKEAETSSTALWPLGLNVQIARHEGRLDDAAKILEDMAARQPGNPYVAITERVEIAEQQGDLDTAIRLLEDSAKRTGSQDFGRVARLYLRKGDLDKAFDYWDKQALLQGSYGYVEAMRQLIDGELWDHVAPYYERCRDAVAREPHALRQIDEMVVRAFLQTGQFRELVENQILAGDSPHLADIARSFFWNDALDYRETRRLLDSLAEKFADNPDFIREYAGYLRRNEDNEEAVALYKKLLEQRPEDAQVRREYAQALSEDGRSDEAVEMLMPWVEANPAPDRVRMLAQVLQQTGRPEAVLELRDRLLATARPEQQEDLRVQFTPFQADAGDVEGARETLRAWFEKAPRADSFDRYFRFLSNRGFVSEAYDLLIAHKDAVFTEWRQIDMSAIVGICLARNDLDTLEEAVWARWQAGGPGDPPHRIRELLGHNLQAQGRGQLLERFLARLRAEEEDPTNFLPAFAQLYEEANLPEKALALYDECLQKDPRQKGVVVSKLNVLQRLGRNEERLALLESLTSQTRPEADGDLFLNLARAYFEAGRPDDAEAILASFDPGLVTRHAYEIGSIYTSAGLYDKAIAAYEKLLDAEHMGFPRDLVACYIKADRIDDARKLWSRAREGYDVFAVAQALNEARLYDEAREFLEPRLRNAAMHPQILTFYSKALAAAGDHEGHRAVFRELCADLPNNRRQNFVHGYAQFLANEGLISDTIASEAFLTDPNLQQAVIHALNYGGPESDGRGELAQAAAERLKDVPLPPETAYALVQNLYGGSENALAVEYIRRVGEHPDATESMRMMALNTMVGASPADALPLCEAVVAARPRQLVENESVLQALAASAETARVEAVMNRLPEVARNETEERYVRALYDFHRGEKEAAVAKLKEMTDAAELLPQHRIRAMYILVEAGESESALACLDGLIETGMSWDNIHPMAALGVEQALRIGDCARALRYFSLVSPYSQGDAFDRARNAINREMRAEHLDSLKAAAEQLIAADPENGYVSDIAGLYAQLAQRFDRPGSAAEFAAAAGASEDEVREARLWDVLIEDWAISEPYPFNDGRTAMASPLPPELAALAEGTASLKDTPGEWRRSDPKRALGLVRVDEVLAGKEVDPQQGEFGNRAAYAVVAVNSPDDREVTFAHGSDDWVRIWVNGEEAHSNLQGRSAVVDQDRFRVPLKAGRNIVLMRVANNYGDWQFSLAPVEGGEGLTVAPPE